MTPGTDLEAKRRASNLRLAIVLGSIAAAFFVGFVAKVALFGL